VSSYCYTCVLTLLYMCPHTAIRVPGQCPHTPPADAQLIGSRGSAQTLLTQQQLSFLAPLIFWGGWALVHTTRTRRQQHWYH
jgi:hypothetical protein